MAFRRKLAPRKQEILAALILMEAASVVTNPYQGLSVTNTELWNV